jgi:hypothetical protein
MAKRIAVMALKNATEVRMNARSAIRKIHCSRSRRVMSYVPKSGAKNSSTLAARG